MKRIGVLLSVLVALVWIGSILTRGGDPTKVGGEAAAVEQKEGGSKDSDMEPASQVAEKKAQQEKWFGPETIVAARRAVMKELKDPGSAEFEEVRANYTEEFGVVACGRVNAKNELGSYTGFRRFVSSGQSVILEGRDNFEEAWSQACN